MLTVVEKVLLLQDMEIFGFAQTEDLAQFAAVCRETEVSPGMTLFREGEIGRTLFLLVRGGIVLEKDGLELEVVNRGGLDIWSFFADSEQKFTARAVEESLLLTITFDEIVDLLTSEPEFCWAITRQLAVIARFED
jgi:CRP-like cAMP-binding protein